MSKTEVASEIAHTVSLLAEARREYALAQKRHSALNDCLGEITLMKLTIAKAFKEAGIIPIWVNSNNEQFDSLRKANEEYCEKTTKQIWTEMVNTQRQIQATQRSIDRLEALLMVQRDKRKGQNYLLVGEDPEEEEVSDEEFEDKSKQQTANNTINIVDEDDEEDADTQTPFLARAGCEPPAKKAHLTETK